MIRYTINTLVPALALLAVGCSSPTAMQSTEYDDMYYTSSDKTEYVQPEATAEAEERYESEDAVRGGVINPEYSDERIVINDYDGDEYYDGRTYDPRNNWYRPNYSYIDPYWASAYAPMYSSRYYAAVRDPFYDPFFYDPFYYDSFYNSFNRPYWGNSISVSLVFGNAWGTPFWGNPYARPYYSSWYPYNNYYNGFNQGYYYGRNQYIYDRPAYVQTRQVQYGPRTERSKIVTGDSREAGGRPDRGSLSTDNGQQAVMPGTDVNTRPSRTRGQRIDSDDSNSKRVIITRPEVNRRSRSERVIRSGREQEQVIPIERTKRSETRGEYSPAREREQPVRRQEVRPIERRERSVPVQAPTRSYERRTESRQDPVRSSSSESRGGRPSRGGN